MADTLILIVGAGAIGSILGGILLESRHDVSLLGRLARVAESAAQKTENTEKRENR